MQLAVTSNFCAAGSTATGSEFISNVAIGSINQTSGMGASGYQDFTSKSKTLRIGEIAQAVITLGNGYVIDQILIWVDWNHDGDFTDTGENVIATVGDLVYQSNTANFTVPTGAAIGTTRLRIRLHDTINGPNATPCGNSSYGEVEDYTINVTLASDIEQTELNNSIKIYPNPASESFHINGFVGKASLKLTDISGKEILTKQVTGNESVSISTLSKGIYIVKIIITEGTVERKLVKK